MKVLQIINSLHIGGAEKLLLDSIPIYKQKGMEMELLLLNGNETPFLPLLKKQGIKIYSLTKGNIKKIYNPLLLFRIIPYIKQYDIIHVHLFPSLYWVALARVFSLKNTKLIFTEHSTNNKRREKGAIWRVLEKMIYRQYKKIVSITFEVNMNIQNHLCDKGGKFTVINNGIDISQYECDLDDLTVKNADKSKITIIQVAGFRESKDQPTLIRSLQYMPNHVQLLLVGDGENRRQCEQLARDLDLSDRVSFLGLRTDVPQLLKSSDIVVMSSHWEGFGLAAVEGMAAGKPVIASNLPGLNDVVNNAGLLFEKGNEKDLAAKINHLLSDPELYSKISLACLERSKQYDINVMIEKYIELYKEILR